MRFSDWSSDVCSSDLLPLPHLLDEILAAVVGALVLPLLELALDDHLRRDAGMIGADDPQSILAAQALVADEHVLQRGVERMAEDRKSVGWGTSVSVSVAPGGLGVITKKKLNTH